MAVIPETLHVCHSVISKILFHLTHTCFLICMRESLKADFFILFLFAYFRDTSLKLVLLVGANKNVLSINTCHFVIFFNTDSCFV